MKKTLDKHVCRIQIYNPEYFDMYMKNWYIKNACIPVFSRKYKKEMILLHSEHCWDLPLNIDRKKLSYLDSSGLFHVPAKKSSTLMEDNSINWIGLRCVKGKLVDYQVI